MPVVDWTRTDLRWPLPSGGSALRFDLVDFVAYDAFLLERPGAGSDYPAPVVAEAQARACARRSRPTTACRPRTCGRTWVAFLRAVVPVAEEAGVRLCVHPDDPPFPLFGLPRRRAEGRVDAEIPMRPNHGHLLLDDRGKARINPGYSAIGRLKGLAELRGVARALEAGAPAEHS